MHPDTDLVIKLQSLDQRMAALEKEVAALPKHITAIEKTLDLHLRKLDADKAALAANQKDRKQLEVDIQMHQQKISKLRDQMLGAKNNEQYRAFQHEIEYAEKEIRQAEDRILELMSQSEPLEANVKKAEAALKQEKQQVEAEKTAARERTAADQAQLDQIREERAQAAAKLPPATLLAYARISKKWRGGPVIAEAVGSRCTACQIILRPQYHAGPEEGRRVDVLRKLRPVRLLQSARQRRGRHPPRDVIFLAKALRSQRTAHQKFVFLCELSAFARIWVRCGTLKIYGLPPEFYRQSRYRTRGDPCGRIGRGTRCG